LLDQPGGNLLAVWEAIDAAVDEAHENSCLEKMIIGRIDIEQCKIAYNCLVAGQSEITTRPVGQFILFSNS
jgi:hypothetical protein